MKIDAARVWWRFGMYSMTIRVPNMLNRQPSRAVTTSPRSTSSCTT